MRRINSRVTASVTASFMWECNTSCTKRFNRKWERVFRVRLSGVVYLLKSLFHESFVEIIMMSVDHRHVFFDHRGKVSSLG